MLPLEKRAAIAVWELATSDSRYPSEQARRLSGREVQNSSDLPRNIMCPVNDTKFKYAMFILTGISGQEDVHLWISIPFCITYAMSIAGNSVILFIIKTDSSLHEPMYIFLSMLALTDLGLLIATMPTILGIYLLNSREISINACIAQAYFLPALQCSESAVLLLMAFDRFIAISNPLRYASILTVSRISRMALVCVLRSLLAILPFPLLLMQLQYSRDNVLSHSYCRNEDIMKLTCSDTRINSVYGLSIQILTMGLDFLLIFLSYVMILKTVLSIASYAECLKALNTCVSHLCAVLVFYSPDIILSILHRFATSSSPLVQNLLSYASLLVPPLMNPIVYSVKSKELRVRIVRMFTK
ncbi:olfactory receptor 51A4-like [Carettochelys insculpta]|uniref:olfactory receptor 51A4-like n=1 Tax=Carettochelys insculpta TaxID=44489 RepID=UPI003EB8A257